MRKPVYQIIYANKDVTKDFTPFLQDIVFKEFLENKAAEIDLSFLNGNNYFFNDWYPKIDDAITIRLGYQHEVVMNCGQFWVDDVSMSGSRRGDLCNIRAISAKSSSINSPIVAKNIDKKPISEIVKNIASELGYNAKGDLSGNWTGLQKSTGLAFLMRLARETGKILKIEGTDLVFYPLNKIKSASVVASIDKYDVIEYFVTDNPTGRISTCTVKSWRKDKKLLVTGQYHSGIIGGGSIVVWDDCEDTEAANNRAKSYVEDEQKQHMEFTLKIPGNVNYRPGIRVKITGFGIFNRTYYISSASHTIDKNSGYITKITLQND